MFKRVDYNYFHGKHDNPTDSDSDSESEDGLPSHAEENWQDAIAEGSSSDGEKEPEIGDEQGSSDEEDESEKEKAITEDISEENGEDPDRRKDREVGENVSGITSSAASFFTESKGKRKVREVKKVSDLKDQWSSLVDEEEEERLQEKRLEGMFEDEYSVVRVGAEGKVLKCRVCPKLLCISEASMDAHLKSKGHGRSMKKLAEGRLPAFINSDGELEEEAETHAERAARTLATAQLASDERNAKKNSGRQRQRARTLKKLKVVDKEPEVVAVKSNKLKDSERKKAQIMADKMKGIKVKSSKVAEEKKNSAKVPIPQPSVPSRDEKKRTKSIRVEGGKKQADSRVQKRKLQEGREEKPGSQLGLKSKLKKPNKIN